MALLSGIRCRCVLMVCVAFLLCTIFLLGVLMYVQTLVRVLGGFVLYIKFGMIALTGFQIGYY